MPDDFLSRCTPGDWTVDWGICSADSSDVKYAKTEGREIKVGDELWRVPASVGPLSADHSHWVGWHLTGTEEDATIMAASKKLYLALCVVREAYDEGPLTAEHIAVVDKALAYARGEVK